MVSRSVIVTGGLGGIGLAAATAFASEGAKIALLDAREDKAGACETLRSAGAADAISIAIDVSDEEKITAAFSRTVATFDSLDVLVNVAGMMIYKEIVELTAADWRRLLDVNLIGAAICTGEAFRHMRPGSSVVNVASVHARRTTPSVAPYAAAKAGLISFTRSAAIEGRPLGIRVNAVLPGAVDTQMLRDSPAIKSGLEVLDPADVGRPEDVAAAVVFLASEAARFITGADIVADAGRMGRL